MLILWSRGAANRELRSAAAWLRPRRASPGYLYSHFLKRQNAMAETLKNLLHVQEVKSIPTVLFGHSKKTQRPDLTFAYKSPLTAYMAHNPPAGGRKPYLQHRGANRLSPPL